VRATGGERAGYRPLATPLATGSDPVAVALGLRSLFAFPVLYVADLDGIEGRGRDEELASQIAEALPGVTLWVDDGTPPREVLARRRTIPPGVVPVIGAEAVQSPVDVAALRALSADGYVLSLDFMGERFAGAAEVLAEPEYWPYCLIVMTLARVGAGMGPDLRRVAETVAQAAGRAVYAAGGVRDVRDIEALGEVGAAGVLVASALHAGKITAGDLQKIAGR